MKIHQQTGEFFAIGYHLTVSRAAEAAYTGKQSDRFKQIGLALAVVAVDDVYTLTGSNAKRREITKIGRFKF